ncbi:MAG: primosomal protein N' [Myxococcales bacterium]|nr:primosomal protein N' [Myxococcales bacterium]
MSPPRLIDVALPLPLAQPLTYAVPSEWDERVAIGMRVLVPLRGRRVTGTVVAFREAAPELTGIKPIADVLDAAPTLPASMLPFLRWLAQYYKASLGEVIDCALPAGLKREELRHAELTERGREAALSGCLADGSVLEGTQRAVIAALARGAQPLRTLLRPPRELRASDLVQAERLGLVTIQYEWRGKTELEKSVDVYRFVSRRGSRASDQQRAILDYLEPRDGVSRDELRAALGAKSDTLRRLCERGLIAVEKQRVFRDPFQGEALVPHDAPTLTASQAAAVARVVDALDGGFGGYLLHGITGSGKTEVYLHVIAAVRRRGQSALLLVPEIALTPQLAARVRGRFGDEVALLHSALGPGARYDQWSRVLRGEAPIVLGARSAIFAPLENLGVVIVDEEHEPSFKQEEVPRYNARDAALVRAQQAGCPVILGSATPSLESRANVDLGKLVRIELPERPTPQPLPTVELVDLREHAFGGTDYRFLVTPPLEGALRSALDAREQAILFLNRRGFASFVLCRACGQAVQCEDCSISMTYHRRRDRLVCHYCDATRGIPEHCPHCGAAGLSPLGFGTERVQMLCQSIFPGARIERMDRDTTRGQNLRRLLRDFRSGRIDLLIGTQMLAKGHDFPNVTVVGVIAADTGLNFPDFRAGERTFQLLTQVAGRAGRGEKPGRVLIETFCPEHYVLRCAQRHDFDAFMEQELRFRREASYPPFAHLALCRFAGEDGRVVERYGRELAAWLKRSADPEVKVLGPAAAPIERIRGQTRHQILLKSSGRPALHRLIDRLLADGPDSTGVRLVVDVDPIDLM